MNKRTSKEIADQAALYVSTRLDTPPTLLEVAHAVSTNTRVLKFAFQQTYGMSLAVYGRQLRLKKAQYLLLTSDMQVEYIAHECGYSDGPGLTEAFIRVFGVSPGRWKRGHLPPG